MSDHNFYSLENLDIHSILKDESQETSLHFISKFYFEKGAMTKETNNESNSLVSKDVDQESSCMLVDPSSLIASSSYNSSKDISLSEGHHTSSPNDACFSFKENEVFHFLNAPTNLHGNIILGKYKLTKTLDLSRLKDLLICDKLNENNVTYK